MSRAAYSNTWRNYCASLIKGIFLERMVKDMETTYVMVKPDGVQRGFIGEIIGRFEQKGLKLVGLKAQVPSEEIARAHYAVRSERPFFPGLIKFVIGPVVCMAGRKRCN